MTQFESQHQESTGESSVKELAATVETLAERVEELEHTVEQKDERIEELEAQVEDNDERIAKNAKDGALGRKSLRDRIVELQERELLKDAHIAESNLDAEELADEHQDNLGKVTKDDGETYWYLGKDTNDPVEANEDARSKTRISTADLLPVQQLASMDDETLEQHANTVPDKWAAKVWDDRATDELGIWNTGSKGVREWFDSSDLSTVIYMKADVSRESAQEYARRTIKALKDLTHHRVRVENTEKRSDGLKYKETRLVIDADAEIPGEPRADAGADAQLGGPETRDVAGD